MSGSVVRYNADYGAMRIDFVDARATFAFYTVDGDLIDEIVLDKPCGAAVSGTTSSPRQALF